MNKKLCSDALLLIQETFHRKDSMEITAVTELFLPKGSHVWMNTSEACLSVSHASLFCNQETASISAHCSEGQLNTGLPVSDIHSTAWVWHIKFLASSQRSLNI